MKRQLEDEQLQRSPRSTADTQRQMFQKAAQNFSLHLAASEQDNNSTSEPMDLTAYDSSPENPMLLGHASGNQPHHGFHINAHPMVLDNYLQSVYPQQSASSFIAGAPVILQAAVNDNAGPGGSPSQDKPMPPLQPLQQGQVIQIKQERHDDRDEIQVLGSSNRARNNQLLAINRIGNAGGQESDSSDDSRNPEFHERLLEISKDEV